MVPGKPESSSSTKIPTRSGISPGLHPASSFASLRQANTHSHASPLSASVDKTSAFAETGEVQSGRALSVGRRARDDWIVNGQEKALASDSKFRKYASLLERTLLSIDQVNEWADFITFLAKLLKTLQSYPQYSIIPHKLIVAKRLSQCLNPALPQGVHQRALDVYVYILTTIGLDGLRRDLQVWSAGLFPFFQYAATAVRPIVLGLFEKFYLPLKADLRPSMKAFILALLPGLEEETGEHFDRVCSLLDQLSSAISLSFFLQNVWLILISGPGYRIPAINFLSRRMPPLLPQETIVPIVGQDVGLMIRGHSAALEDGNILVQRGILDLLLANLKLDSQGFCCDTRHRDRLLLTRAALGVVLRRDLSLSRRLYTWLMGPPPTAEDGTINQSKYFQEHGLDLVVESLRQDMMADYVNAVVERQRPFKVFIALLDKWEIGGPLSRALALDAFKALQVVLKPEDTQDELLLTANMMFDSLDPFTTWKSIFESISQYADPAKEPDQVDLIKFILATFRLHDEELLRVHIPLLATALVCVVDEATQAHPDFSLQRSQEILEVATTLFQDLPNNVFDLNSPSTSPPMNNTSGLDLARRFYSAESLKLVNPEDMSRLRDSNLCSSTFAAILRVIERFASGEPTPANYQVLSASLTCLDTLISSLPTSLDQITVDWTPLSFTESLLSQLRRVNLNAAGFALFEKSVKVMLGLAGASRIQPRLLLDDQTLLSTLVVKLLDFLEGHTAPFFLQAIKLIWELQKISQFRHVETIIASRLTSENPSVRVSAFEAFGNLWRHSEDAQLPGNCLRIPMLLVLDSLKSNDLTNRRCGEAWMRCSLKSYLRVLDPLFRILLSTEIKRKPFKQQLGDHSTSMHHYIYPFDQAVVHHALECVLTLARFGGQGFTRIAKTCYMKHSHDPSVRQLLPSAGLESASYLDALIKIMLLFINSDPHPKLLSAMSSRNQHIQATTADLLQMLVSRGDIPSTDLGVIEETLSFRLLLLIRSRDYNLQNKLLHALHATISVGTSTPQSRHSISADVVLLKDKPESENPTVNQLFTILVGDGITNQVNTAIVHHWIDFLLMTVPQIRRSLDEVVKPLIDRLVHRLRMLVLDLEKTYQMNGEGNLESDFTDSDFLVFVNALERLMVVSIEGEGASAGTAEASSGKSTNERPLPPESTGGLFAGVFNVLGSSEISTNFPLEQPKTEFQLRLGNVVWILMKAWDVSLQIGDEKEPESSNSKLYFSVRIKLRARKAFERLYKAVPNDVIVAIVDYWHSEVESKSPNMSEDNMFLLLDHLAPSAQTIVSMLYEKLASYGHLAGTDKGRAIASTCFLSENIMFSFLESYISRLEGPIAVQMWNSSWSFARDVLANSTVNKNQLFPTLKCFTILAEKISQTSALEDRRMRRDLQDTFVKLCEVVIQTAGKYLDQLKGKPDFNGDQPTISLEKEPPASPLVASTTLTDERKASDSEKPVTGAEAALFLSEKALPSCRRFLIESDRLQAVCTNIMYYLVTPAFKVRIRSSELDVTILNLLVEMTKHPAANRAWRAYVADSLSDPKFFNNSPELGRRWRPIIQALFNTDKERFTEMLSRLSTVPSANIFTNKEAEMVTRSMSLRRITYAIYAAEYNRFLVHLPSIQEKVVDLLRSSVGEIVHAEVYICMRVLLCRIANQHLGSFWPVILTELTRFFEGIVESVPDSPNMLALALSASKFLDLLLVLQTEDFQIHQWMFITDTIDAMYPPDSWYPHAIIDRIAEGLRESLANQLSDGRRDSPSPPPLSSPRFVRLMTPSLSRNSSFSVRPPNTPRDFISPHGSQNDGRKPLLNRIKKIENIRPLERFFSKISMMNYEACYAGGGVDWDSVELDLECDLFDGKDHLFT
ncbi:hypothetical protein PtA15_1A451 [Puccinia triticina]|uniref:Dopey N-terminal domain-containing protein n=1 Tax=Puccinia triticina TaxID=208348 RepID=A0ABY7C7G1_9BASI|nr:uncharacterized protein PtA15_1A451 [Puccinia triticina]WAQ81113.1 hypothetical protein PtA15_1A451 [Puccinia triticina]WAR52002.1 hypothetical protein PtB15_1B440 [Puccinia triticina]